MHDKLIRLFSIVYCLFCFSGCSYFFSMESSRHFKLNSCEQVILKPAQYERADWRTFRVTIIDSLQVYDLRIQAEIDQNSVNLVALSPLGMRGLLITISEQEVKSIRSRILPLPIEPQQLLSMFQFALWPLSQLKETYKNCDLNLESALQPFNQRFLYAGKKLQLHLATLTNETGKKVSVVSDMRNSVTVFIREE